MVSSKLDMESALGMLTTLERKPKKLGIKVGKIMHVLSKELYSVWLQSYTKSDKSLLGIKRATVKGICVTNWEKHKSKYIDANNLDLCRAQTLSRKRKLSVIY